MSTQETTSSDYYDNDPDFLKALTEAAIDGEAGQTTSTPHTVEPVLPKEEPTHSRVSSTKRPHSPDNDQDGTDLHGVLGSVHAGGDTVTYLDNHTYGASRFGEFGEYMARKRAKLQIQNAEMDTEEEDSTPRIFKGLEIYVSLFLLAYHLFSWRDRLSFADQWLDRPFRSRPTCAHH